MNFPAYVAMGSLAFATLVQLIGCVVWMVRLEGRINVIGNTSDNRLTALEKAAEGHAELRDIVIEMRADMRSVVGSIREFSEAIREMQKNPRRSSV